MHIIRVQFGFHYFWGNFGLKLWPYIECRQFVSATFLKPLYGISLNFVCTQYVDVHITMKFRPHYFSVDFYTFVVVKDKSIDIQTSMQF